MTKNSISGLSSRTDLADRLIRAYKSRTAKKITLLSGPSGCGKSFVINKIIAGCKTRFLDSVHICPYINYGDSFVQISGQHGTHKISDVSLSIGTPFISVGAGVGIQSEATQYNQLKSILRGIVKTDILICLDGLSTSEHSVKTIAKLILSHLEELESSLSVNIFFLISDIDYDSCISFVLEKFSSIECISMLPYDTGDIYAYLKEKHLNLTITEKISKNIEAIKKISNGNLSLVDFLFVDIAIQDNSYFEALEKVVNYRLLRLKEASLSNHIAEAEMEDIILSAALSLQRFSASEISHITHRDNNIVANGLDIAQEEKFVDKDSECFYDFHCSEIKNVLWEQSVDKRKERLLHYYQYYTENEQDEYYFRAFYLTKYAGKITSQAFALLGLSFIYSDQSSDHDMLAKINRLLQNYATAAQQEDYKKIGQFYQLLSNPQTTIHQDSLYGLYGELRMSGYEIPLQGELARAYFHFLYRNRPPFDSILNSLLNECLQFAQNPICLSHFTNPIGLKESDETIIRLHIIYSIAPCLLDVRNEVERFTDLYQLSQTISRSCKAKGEKGLAQYIENVFNRKAFLFANQTQCGIYYEKAKVYFSNHQIWDEYCLTLVCQAGTDIVIQEYGEAKACCEQALAIANMYGISLPQSAKLYNNLLIASFLESEHKEKNKKKCVAKARETIRLLRKQLTKKPCATEYVVLTNLCSLCLYCGDDSGYMKYKTKLQHLMSCSDVSDVKDEDVDDFYRYYFAWFEVFRMIRDEKWEQAERLYNAIDGFIPALFRKQEVFWEKKNHALANLIQTQTSLSPYDFCNNLVHTPRRETVLSKFFFRGLMLSDLQYTSYN